MRPGVCLNCCSTGGKPGLYISQGKLGWEEGSLRSFASQCSQLWQCGARMHVLVVP